MPTPAAWRSRLVVGKMRSSPPPWTSRGVAQLGGREHRALDVATDAPPPGRRQLGSPLRDGCQRTKSSGARLRGRQGRRRAPRRAQHLLRAEPGEVPVPGSLRPRNRPAVHRVGHAGIRDPRDPVQPCGNVLAGKGRRIHRRMSMGAHVPVEVADHLVGQLPPPMRGPPTPASCRHPRRDVADAAHRLTEARSRRVSTSKVW